MAAKTCTTLGPKYGSYHAQAADDKYPLTMPDSTIIPGPSTVSDGDVKAVDNLYPRPT